jgi:hypothetical protein
LINGRQACYIVLTPDKPLYTPDFDGEIEAIRNDNNKNGDIIKVVLGTNVSVEGIDFKNIREIHMVEPWYHLNKVAQIIGRAVRNCSHVGLEPAKRNVTVYHHVNVINRKKETIDTRVYRIAENKQTAMEEVEYQLKKHSVDCSLNRNALYFNPKHLNMQLDIITSQGTLVSDYSIGDRSKSLKIKCAFQPPKLEDDEEEVIDDSTFDISFYHDDVDLYASFIALLFRDRHAYNLQEIRTIMHNEHNKTDDDIIYFALEYMLNTKYQVITANRAIGFLIYRGSRYMFQPADEVDLRLTNKNRQDYTKLMQKRIDINRHLRKDVVDTHNTSTKKQNKKKDVAIEKADDESDDDNERNIVDEDLVNSSDVGDALQLFFKVMEGISADELLLSKVQQERFKSSLIDYTIDRLQPVMTNHICQSLLNKNLGALNHEEQLVAKSLVQAHILVLDETNIIKWMRNIYEAIGESSNAALSDRVDSNIYILNKKTRKLEKASPFDMQDFTARNQTSKDAFLFKLKEMKGLMSIEDDNGKWVSKFKVIDSSKANSTGSVCKADSKLKSPYLAKVITDINRDVQVAGKKKPTLCNLYELILRSSSDVKMFARPYEAFILPLMQKQPKATKPKTTKLK